MATSGIYILALDGNEVDLTLPNGQLVWSASKEGIFIPFGVLLRCTAIVGVISSPTVTFGSNSPNFDNIKTATLTPTFNAVDDIIQASFAGNTPAIVGGMDLYCKASVPAMGTTLKVRPYLLGYYA